MEFSFFTTDNKSGYKSTEKWFSKNYPEEYNKIIQHSVKYSIGETFKEKIWVYFNNLTQRPKCLTCNGEIKKGFDSSKTEKEIMTERNYSRIYDCGHLVYEFQPKF
jgi:hypothetical protein